MCQHNFYKTIKKGYINVLFFIFVLFFCFFSFPVFAAKQNSKSGSGGRAYTKHYIKSDVVQRSANITNVLVSTPNKEQTTEPVVVSPKVDENAINEAKAIRNFRTAELSRLKNELAELKAEMKNSGQCTVDGRQIKVSDYRAKINSAKALSKIDKVAKINQAIADKKNVVNDLESRINEKEETAKKMIAGTVATSTLAVAGTAGLGVAIADLVKTKMSAKKLQNGEAVCGKYGLLVR